MCTIFPLAREFWFMAHFQINLLYRLGWSSQTKKTVPKKVIDLLPIMAAEPLQ